MATATTSGTAKVSLQGDRQFLITREVQRAEASRLSRGDRARARQALVEREALAR
jgi:hypothetical protein